MNTVQILSTLNLIYVIPEEIVLPIDVLSQGPVQSVLHPSVQVRPQVLEGWIVLLGLSIKKRAFGFSKKKKLQPFSAP